MSMFWFPRAWESYLMWQKALCKHDSGYRPWDGEILLDCLSGPSLITWVLKIGQPFLDLVRKKEMAAGEGFNVPLLVLSYRRCVPGTKSCQQLYCVRKRSSARTSKKDVSPANALILAWWDPGQNSDRQNYRVVYLYCFKPQGLR